MHTPPVTKLKSDLELELRGVREEISKQNAALEIVQEQRSAAESGFAAREKRCIDREADSEKTLDELVLEISDADEQLQKIKNEIVKHSASAANVALAESKANEKHIEGKKSREGVLEAIDLTIETQKITSSNLDQQIKEKHTLIDAAILHLRWLSTISRKLTDKIGAAALVSMQSAEALSKREWTVVNKEKDIAILSSRLIKQYRDAGSDVKVEKMLSY